MLINEAYVDVYLAVVALHPAPARAPPQVHLQQGKEVAEGGCIERIVCDIIILLCTWLLLQELLLLLLLLLFLGDGELRPLLLLGGWELRALLLLGGLGAPGAAVAGGLGAPGAAVAGGRGGDGELRPLLCLIVCWMRGRTNKDDTTAVACQRAVVSYSSPALRLVEGLTETRL